MGNNRFRLSDMMPNAWFYKLKDMGRSRNHRGTTTHSMKKKKQPTSAASSPAAATHTQTQPSKPNKQQQAHHHQQYSSYPRKSYYFTRKLIPKNDHNSPTATHFPDHDPPRRSSKQRAKIRNSTAGSSPRLVTSSVSAGCNCRATLRTKSDTPPNYSASPSDSSLEDDPEICDTFPPEFRCDRVLPTESFDKMLSWSTPCNCELDSDSPKDIVIDVDKKSIAIKESNKLVVFNDISDFDLPPIVTKPAKFSDEIEEIKKKRESTKEPSRHRRSSETDANGSFSVKVVGEDSISSSTTKGQKGSSVKRYSPHSPGVKLRIHSPRVASRRFHQGNGRRSVSSSSSSTSSSRRSLSDSLAIVKSSFDPQRDFRESMVEMIVENNIRASKDLEDLLACYLQLNSDEYHGLIIKVFKQIWFDLTDVRSK